MQFLGGVWATLTTVVSYLSLSPLPDSATGNQVPLAVPQPEPSSTYSPISLTALEDAPGPTFRPEGASDGFQCEYPEMKGWKYCGNSTHRQCWLESIANGTRYDVFTNYEDKMPIGILREKTIEIADGFWDKDGLNFDAAKLFNKTYPGPWIEACWGDRVQIKVINKLHYNGTSVHWHGIRQLNSTHMDGVNGVTQCPIAPNDYFVYDWTARQYGSSWYHSHYSVQYADGAAGPLTLYGPASAEYDEAVKPILMTDWGHSSAFVGGKLVHPDILLNGRGDITKYKHDTPIQKPIEPPYNVTFVGYQPGKTIKRYLLRIINVSYDTTFVVSIDNHMMQITSADFVPITPYMNTSVLVGIGQRYNVIVEANPLENNMTGHLDPEGNYWIRTTIANCFGKGNPDDKDKPDEHYDETGIIRYNESSKSDPTTTQWKNIALNCSDETYTDLHPIYQWVVPDPVPKKQLEGALNASRNSETPEKDRSYPLATFSLDLTGKFTPLRVNYSDPVFLNLNKSGDWLPAWRIITEPKDSTDWVYLVIQSKDPHPMHLHGHDFAILEQAYNKSFDLNNLNLQLLNPPRRDVVLLPSGGDSGGYVVIAFKADNPGPWLLHCHIAAHISRGLGLTIMERQQSAYDRWPEDSPVITEARRVCSNWNEWHTKTASWAPNPTCMSKHWKDPDLCFQDDSGV